LEHTHNLVEEAAAAPLAASLYIKERLKNKNIVLVVTGGNLSMQNLKMAIANAE